MIFGPELLLVGAVAAVGVLHTMVPDHWLPIALIARQRGWSTGETARAALQAAIGHVGSTLLIGLAVWVAGVALAARFGQFVDAASSIALIGFGGWIAVSAWRELHPARQPHRPDPRHPHTHPHPHGHGHGHSHDTIRDDRDHGQRDGGAEMREPAPADDPLYAPLRGETALLTRHTHTHRHGRGTAHSHWHDHLPATAHAAAAVLAADPPLHLHRHRTTARTALLLILGSSPMVEGIPAFFAAARYGAGLIVAMAAAFTLGTIAAYVLLCVYSTAGLQRVQLGALERYGEVLSGAFIALVGVVFGIWSAV